MSDTLEQKPMAGLQAMIRCLRPHQWSKNLIIFVPALAGHKLGQPRFWYYDVCAFIVFCLCASGAYVINDLMDVASDRLHPRKRNRPFARGDLSSQLGWTMGLLLLLCGLSAAAVLSLTFTVVVAAYVILTTAYSLWIRKIELLDVFTLAALYTMRLIAGYTAGIAYSAWLLMFSMFVFLSLALLKRYTELSQEPAQAGGRMGHRRGYRAEDLKLIASLGMSCGCLATLVLGLYVNSQQVLLLYHHPMRLLLLCPLWLYWISHVWLASYRGEMHDDPIVFAFRDRGSYIIGALILGALWLATIR
jgi:4-hydroxybenzoate polyprenyltransferase